MKGKKLVFVIAGGILAFIVIAILAVMLWAMISLKSVSKESEEVNFSIATGSSSASIVEDLYDAGLIKNETVALIYLKLNDDISLQAGDYVLNKNMSTPEIFDALQSGVVYNDSVSITFIEGETLKKFITRIADKFEWNEEELHASLADKEYLQNLINEYWFLEDTILDEDIYYALEGYLFPETYSFHKDATFNDIIKRMLNQTDLVLSGYRKQLEDSDYSVHEILTMASIIEKEALSDEDRTKVSQVILKRIAIDMNLGMDVTSYYGVQKEMTETITAADLNNNNPYNTRVLSFKGLPIGPICNPSESSIKAALNPADTDYIYFFADITTGKVYFTEDYNEFLTFKEIYG